MSEKIKVEPGTEGQNPQWPGEKCKNPGRYGRSSRKQGEGEVTEETIVPFVDSIPGKQSDGEETL